MEMKSVKSGPLKYQIQILGYAIFFIQACCGNECDECIQLSPEMNFCFHNDFKGPRCERLENLKDCQSDYIEKNSHSLVTILKDEDFRNFEILEKRKNYIQLKPQKLKLDLRKGDAVNFTFSYKPAENYPLEVYYLMDLTFSMKNDLETLINLGGELGYSLKNISEHFRIAFGSYVDKLRMPFSFTNPDNIENPCNHTSEKVCAKSYLLKHIQNFTNDVELFAREVRKKSNTSANLDDLEGGMEALMQVLLCGNRVGWSEVSRKLVIISTGSYMHLAGDGILSGTVMKNPGKCLVDFDGNYPADNPYDYPSLGEIHGQLKKQKVNVIFAVKEKVLSYYRQMGQVLKDFSFVGILDKDSKNIIQLTKDGYTDFFKRAKFSVDTNHTADLDIEFYANCDGAEFVKTAECSNVVLDQVIDFIVEVRLKNVPENVKIEKLFIVEKNIQEKIEVDLEYYGICRCDSISSQSEGGSCVNGVLRCGKCNCLHGWTGDTCNETCSYSLDPCRKEVDGIKETSCSRRGDCECGKCICDFPYQGKYCEYKCPTYRGKICSGHGNCQNSESCSCDKGYIGKDCSCEDSTRNCMVLGKICNNRGRCECNKCMCSENYKGRKCEYYVGKTGGSGYCSEFINQTMNFVENGTMELFYGNISIRPLSVSKEVKLAGEGICFARSNNRTHYCEINYSYNLEQQPIVLKIQPYCYKKVSAAVVAPAIVFSVFAVGLLAVLIWKCVTSRKDRLEYERFQKEVDHQQRSRTENPLYTSPITSYRVPTNKNKIL